MGEITEGFLMPPYSEDLRKRALWDVDLGMSIQAVSEKHRVTLQFVHKLRRRRDEPGQIGPLKTRPAPNPNWPISCKSSSNGGKADPM